MPHSRSRCCNQKGPHQHLRKLPKESTSHSNHLHSIRPQRSHQVRWSMASPKTNAPPFRPHRTHHSGISWILQSSHQSRRGSSTCHPLQTDRQASTSMELINPTQSSSLLDQPSHTPHTHFHDHHRSFFSQPTLPHSSHLLTNTAEVQQKPALSAT